VQQTTELDLAVNTIQPKALAVIAPLNELPLGACPEWVIFDRRAQSPRTAAYPLIASVPGECC